MTRLLSLTILLLLSSFTIFSQNDTSVNLKKSTAIKVVQDLIRLDECQIRIELLRESMAKDEKTISNLEKIITASAEKERNLNLIIGNKDALYSQLQTDYRALEKKYKGSVRLGRFYLVVAVGAVGFGVWHMLK